MLDDAILARARDTGTLAMALVDGLATLAHLALEQTMTRARAVVRVDLSRRPAPFDVLDAHVLQTLAGGCLALGRRRACAAGAKGGICARHAGAELGRRNKGKCRRETAGIVRIDQCGGCIEVRWEERQLAPMALGK